MLNSDELVPLVVSVLNRFDGGELFIEYLCSESLKFQDGGLVASTYADSSGFGLRAFYGDKVLYTHSSDVSYKSIVKATEFILRNKFAATAGGISETSHSDTAVRDSLYSSGLQDDDFPFEKRVALLKDMYDYALSKGGNIASISATFSASIQKVEIIKNTGEILTDDRPMLKLGFSVVLRGEDGRSIGATSGKGGRFGIPRLIENWKDLVDRAFRKAEVNLIAVPCPSGEMTVVLGNGWPGILLHEAIGHGLEADFNRKGASAFSGLVGGKVASDVVSVVDDGTIEAARGSINVDDEGTPSSYNVLIERGVLKNYMFDLMNARLMSAQPTGNGRRESYMNVPLPRMTNTYMLPGSQTPDEIIKTVENGIYAVDFYGGQVDITSGKFVFSASEAYLIENGTVTKPVREMTLIGDGPSVLKQISIVGNDLKLDDGVGTCGKDGQSVPVCVGQPTVKVDRITVGGTA
ncbi:modulator of DNA gyrase family protein [Neorickettsia helminthoeca str. Oregon]|uniref:Modulator of DNA gyrase family protein n=1 Tax=Neorickettsia helminthoeca str. Oregon TaxID=1286528 RepID=X5HLB9_9RICK|nr:metallopeptidase TldD-related protein [Neorickettsia helminthoeca]AHX11170.1 modulator of DNA gyrase family protein [Neorickettsia helminthoeca str. Oregon]